MVKDITDIVSMFSLTCKKEKKKIRKKGKRKEELLWPRASPRKQLVGGNISEGAPHVHLCQPREGVKKHNISY